MWSNVAYFSTWRPRGNQVFVAYFFTWRPRGNQVSKTRFPTPINIENNPEHIRENPEKKKKKTRRTQNMRRAAWVFFTQVCAAQVMRDPGRTLTWAACCLGFFHPSRTRPRSRVAWVFFTLIWSQPTHPWPTLTLQSHPLRSWSSLSFCFWFFFFFLGFFPFSDLKGLFSDLVCLFVCYFFPPGSSFSLIFFSWFFPFSDVKGIFSNLVCLFVCFFFFFFSLINRASETRL